MAKTIIDLLKVNIFLIIFLLTTGGCIYWLMNVTESGEKFTKKLKRSNDENMKKLKALEKVKVILPAKGPYEPSETKFVPMNKNGIDALRQAFQNLDKEKTSVESTILKKNKAQLVPMDIGIFPVVKVHSQLVYLKDIYSKKFGEYFSSWIAEAEGPRLDAGSPPSAEELRDFQKQIDEEYLRGFSSDKTYKDLTASEKKLLVEKKRKLVLEWLTEKAGEIHLYAETNPKSGQFPFSIDSWVNKSASPTSTELWESQMKLWVIETICRVIMKTNQTNIPDTSVLTQPIKRLIKLEVMPGYIGDKRKGALVANSNPNKPFPNFFHLSPSGRQSNTIYDIRHAQLSIVIDWERLPVFLKDLSDYNLITVLSINIEDVDEYEALKQGFVFGKLQDCVKVDMLIETIWLREWMDQWMPPEVKKSLGIKQQ